MTREKKLLWALLVSMSVNLFLAGFFLASRVKHAHHHTDRRAEDARPPPKVVQEMMRQRRTELGPSRKALRDARLQVRDAMETVPLDQARLETALATLREKSNDFQLESHRLLLDVAGELTPEQRRRLLMRREGMTGPRHPR